MNYMYATIVNTIGIGWINYVISFRDMVHFTTIYVLFQYKNAFIHLPVLILIQYWFVFSSCLFVSRLIETFDFKNLS